MMLTADRAVESLVEKFASICSDDYSLTTDRSSEIIDYVMGVTDKFPEMMGKTSHYVYRTVEALEKLSKKEDGDIFFVRVLLRCIWSRIISEEVLGELMHSRLVLAKIRRRTD